MDKIVLKSFEFKNFASFADIAIFTTEVKKEKDKANNNAFQNGDLTFNKVSFIYGANGVGKTYFCKAFMAFKRVIALSPLVSSKSEELAVFLEEVERRQQPINGFALDAARLEEPTYFAMEVLIDNIVYKYEFSILKSIIQMERLTRKYRRSEVILERTSSSYKDIVLKSEMKKFEAMKQVIKENALCLPVAAMLNNKLAEIIISAINKISVISMVAPLKPLNSSKAFSEEMVKKYLEVLKTADPTLRKIAVSVHEEVKKAKKTVDDLENREAVLKRKRIDIETSHAVYTATEETGTTDKIDFFSEESLGTVKLFTELPYLYETLEEGGVLVIDEIENGLHLSLVKEIISLFSDEKTNPNNAQLVCTSHQPLLLQGNFKRDQVWIISKNAFGKSSMHRLSEIKLGRKKKSITDELLENALGCNPDLFFKNSTI